MKRSDKIIMLSHAVVLTAFTGWIALDTFVLPRTYQTEPVTMNMDMFADENEQKEEPAVTELAPEDGEETVSGTTTAKKDKKKTETTDASGTGKTTANGQSGTTRTTTTRANRSNTQNGSGDNGNDNNDSGNNNSSNGNSGGNSSNGGGNNSGGNSGNAAQTTSRDSQQGGRVTQRTEAQTEPPQTDPPQTEPPVIDPVITDNEYYDSNISIVLNQYYEYNTNIFVADIQLSSAQYLKSAFAQNTFGRNITAPTSQIAAENNAILAINGDFYGVHEYGYVVRNGVCYRDLNNGTWLGCLFSNGDLQIISSNTVRGAGLVEQGCWQEWCFGPPLLNNGGQIVVGEDEDVAQRLSSNPRTAIGMISPLHYVFVVSDGRSEGNAGLSLYQLAQFMQQFGTQVLYNLDGGGSTTMYFNGRVVNQPINLGAVQERDVSDIVYIGY